MLFKSHQWPGQERLPALNISAGVNVARRLLLLFVGNVLAHPDDPKYKRVKASNSRYQNAVGSKQGGPSCMLALGFRLQRINGQQVWLPVPKAPLLVFTRLCRSMMAVRLRGKPCFLMMMPADSCWLRRTSEPNAVSASIVQHHQRSAIS